MIVVRRPFLLLSWEKVARRAGRGGAKRGRTNSADLHARGTLAPLVRTFGLFSANLASRATSRRTDAAERSKLNHLVKYFWTNRRDP